MRRVDGWLVHRPRGADVVDTVVLHATATQALAEAVEALRSRGLAYHFLIDRDGAILQLVPADACAFHAGESLGPQGPRVNEYSLGVSFVNLNDGADPYTHQQEAAVRTLLAELCATFPLRWLTTHAAIAPGRKDDPRGYDAEGLASDSSLDFWR